MDHLWPCLAENVHIDPISIIHHWKGIVIADFFYRCETFVYHNLKHMIFFITCLRVTCLISHLVLIKLADFGTAHSTKEHNTSFINSQLSFWMLQVLARALPISTKLCISVPLL